MAKSDTFSQGLWAARSVEDTRTLYDDWADQYDADVMGAGYATPGRIAKALAETVGDTSARLLDFGCGTGISGAAFQQVGFTQIDGADLSAEMLAQAKTKGLYRKLWQIDPDAPLPITQGHYEIIAAVGVVSLGGAPPETLDTLLGRLAPGGWLAFSYNEPTLGDARFLDALAAACDGPAECVFDAFGPHLPGKDMGSHIYILRRCP